MQARCHPLLAKQGVGGTCAGVQKVTPGGLQMRAASAETGVAAVTVVTGRTGLRRPR